VDGYLQSWKYFSQWRNEILNLFQFAPHVIAQADHDFREIIAKNEDAGKSVYYACIHARRGDLLRKGSEDRGYIASDLKLINSAITYLTINRILNDKKGIFRILLFSDDPNWCSRQFSKYSNIVNVVGKQKASVAMRMMSANCDSFLFTSGASTFGWWSAYLSTKTPRVFYNERVTVSGSSLDKEMEKNDYFLPNWKAINLDEG